ncbi:peptidoglycan recognition family protein [Streptomyces sp. B6B3]|uniref:peptidoglycan recognition protein family protein n=1 Tax=Streptomyces sp. B6B3 TaxID=3153570 RepID=UPI00325EC44B
MLFAAAAGVTAAGVAGAALPGTAGAAPTAAAPQPQIDGTEVWGARPPAGTIDILDYTPSMIIIHHAVSANTNDFSQTQAHAHARWVQNLHMDDNGWSDTGYNFVVSRGGWITEGRHRSLETLLGGTSFVFGAHTSGQNTNGIGICNEGAYHDGAVPPTEQWDSVVALCAYACQQYGIPPTELYGHMDFGATLCPGIFHDMLPQLREEVAAAMG